LSEKEAILNYGGMLLDANEKWLSYSDLSERWQIPIQTLRIWFMKGKLRGVKLGRHVRFALSYICEIEAVGF
jgi:hypothetical protein